MSASYLYADNLVVGINPQYKPLAYRENGKLIGIELATAAATAELLHKKLIFKELPWKGLIPAFAALRAKQVGFFIHDAPTSWEIAQTNRDNDLFALYRPLTQESLAWAVKKGNAPLLAELNQALSKLEKNGKLKLVQSHWMPVKVQVGQ